MLSKQDIVKEIGKGINIHPIRYSNIKENSINLTVSRNAWSQKKENIYVDSHGIFHIGNNTNATNRYEIKKGCSSVVDLKGKKILVLLPHQTTIIETSEVISVSNYIGGTFHSKVGIVTKGIGHIGTMLGPNYCGHLMISLHNITNDIVTLNVGETFISLAFYYLDTPVNSNTNSNISGHIDKLAALGININKETSEFLTQEWKTSFEGVKNKMINSENYKTFCKEIKLNKPSIKMYFNKENIITVCVIILIFVLLGITANYLDAQNETKEWMSRFWTLVISGVLVPIIVSRINFIKNNKR